MKVVNMGTRIESGRGNFERRESYGRRLHSAMYARGLIFSPIYAIIYEPVPKRERMFG
jgi:hypothetical protein